MVLRDTQLVAKKVNWNDKPSNLRSLALELNVGLDSMVFLDDSTFEIVPVWQNKLQAMAFEDSLWTRTSHYSYEIKDNNIRISGLVTLPFQDQIRGSDYRDLAPFCNENNISYLRMQRTRIIDNPEIEIYFFGSGIF